uniref:EF-hand calcium binding domain 14 n=1 Tax=Latimeria chalumnae TaxID=7897 RepID=H3B221_LATCH
MKKRKELNALIGLTGDGKRKKAKKGSGHHLLRTEPPASDSESSSEEDEFLQQGADSLFGKGGYLRCCKVCYPLCAFVILAACVVACVGLVWMQVALKEDLDALKEKFHSMESSQKNSLHEIPKLNEDLLEKEKQLESIQTGDRGISKIWLNITEINKQISLLNTAVSQLKATIKSASDLISLPTTVEDLQKSVATIGSTLTSVQHDVETMQTALEEHKKIMDTLQRSEAEREAKESEKPNQTVPPSPTAAPTVSSNFQNENVREDILYLHNALDDVNATLVLYRKQSDLKLYGMDTAVGNLTQRVTSLENDMVVINNLSRRLNSTVNPRSISIKMNSLVLPQSNRTDMIKSPQVKHSVDPGNVDLQVSELREKLQLINALTSTPDEVKINESQKGEKPLTSTSKPTAFPKLVPRSVKTHKRSTKGRHLSLPGIKNLSDLQDLFQKSGKDADGQLSYQDLQDFCGLAALDLRELLQFDRDGNEQFSLTELKYALGL